MSQEQEIWKTIKGYEGLYEISNSGRVKSLPKKWSPDENILIPGINTGGYYQVNLSKNKKQKTLTIHVLVSIAFLGHKPDGYTIVVDHKDNNRLNNAVSNLQLITQRENASKDRSGYSSKYVGVTWLKNNKHWVASIWIKPKLIRIGQYKNEYDAHLAYQEKLKEINKS